MCASVPEVAKFLEEKCLLRAGGRTPGARFERHAEMFEWLGRAIDQKKIILPIDLIHIDAHSDTEGGIPYSLEYLFTELLWLPLEKRRDPRRGRAGLNDSNFIIYLAACHWLNSLKFVKPSTWSDDIQFNYMKNRSASSNALQLRRGDPDQFHRSTWWEDSAIDVEVPFELIDAKDFLLPQPAGFALFTLSPDFTPPTVDPIFDFVLKYITPE